MKNLLNWLVIGGTIALVLLPIAFVSSRAELARWYLAAATNAVQLGNDSPGPYVDRAVSVYAKSEELRDYWLFRVQQALENDPETVVDELRGAIAVDKAFVDLCDVAAASLWNRQQLPEHIQAIEVKREVLPKLNSNDLNLLAYSRSLVGLDLDRALLDIDQAVERQPENYAFRDTRAWVLFQMGRPLEALDEINFAVRRVEQFGQVNSWMSWLDTDPELPEEYAKAVQEAVDEIPTLTQREAGEQLWGTGALYYHRAKILDALGRNDEAARDWEWLHSRNLPTDGSLY